MVVHFHIMQLQQSIILRLGRNGRNNETRKNIRHKVLMEPKLTSEFNISLVGQALFMKMVQKLFDFNCFLEGYMIGHCKDMGKMKSSSMTFPI